MKLILFTSRLPLGKCLLLVTNNIHGNINTVNFFYTKLTLYYFFYVSLVIFQVVRSATGKCMETMARENWDVQEFIGQRAQVKLVDASSDHWGHINFDDLRGDISCKQD